MLLMQRPRGLSTRLAGSFLWSISHCHCAASTTQRHAGRHIDVETDRPLTLYSRSFTHSSTSLYSHLLCYCECAIPQINLCLYFPIPSHPLTPRLFPAVPVFSGLGSGKVAFTLTPAKLGELWIVPVGYVHILHQLSVTFLTVLLTQIRYRVTRLSTGSMGYGIHVPTLSKSASFCNCLCHLHEQVS